MLSSISPVGEASRRQRWSITATAHVVGALAGGAAVGAVLGGLGALVGRLAPAPSEAAVLLTLGGAAALGALLDATRRGSHLPSWRRQVDERWLDTYRGWVYGAGYGLQLGAGVLTIVPTATTYVVGLAALLSGAVGSGAAIGAVFGGARAVPLLLTARVRTPAALTRLMQRVSAGRDAARRTAVLGQAAIAAAAIGAVLA